MVLILFLLYLLYHTFVFLRSAYILYHRRARLKAEIAALRAQEDTLRKRIAFLKSPEGVEYLARTRFGWTRPGEKVYILIPPEEKDGARP